jgi:hypothetical protein
MIDDGVSIPLMGWDHFLELPQFFLLITSKSQLPYGPAKNDFQSLKVAGDSREEWFMRWFRRGPEPMGIIPWKHELLVVPVSWEWAVAA